MEAVEGRFPQMLDQLQPILPLDVAQPSADVGDRRRRGSLWANQGPMCLASASTSSARRATTLRAGRPDMTLPRRNSLLSIILAAETGRRL